MPVGPFICDFLCRELGVVVEVDGGQHAENEADAARTVFLQSEGLTVLRFWNNEVLSNTQGVLNVILSKLEQLPSKAGKTHPQPLPLAGGE